MCGNLSLVKWLLQRGEQWTKDVLRYACINGDVQMLEWTQQSGYFDTSSNQSMYLFLSSSAAKHGHLDVLKWLEKHYFLEVGFCSFAAEHGHKHILEWAFQNSTIDEMTGNFAAKGGKTNVLDWMLHKNIEIDVFVCKSAAYYGHVHVLEWLTKMRQPVCNLLCYEGAVAGGRLNVLHWLERRAFDPKRCICSLLDLAIKSRVPCVVEWVLDHDDRITYNPCELASEYGSVQILEILEKRGFAIDETVWITAAIYDNVCIFDWMKKKNIMFDMESCFLLAEYHRSYYVVQWIIENAPVRYVHEI